MSSSALQCAVTQPASMNLASFRNRHLGESILVCGCGDSLLQLQPPVSVITIGVNDVGRYFDPTYLVVVNSQRQFARDRFEYIRNSRAQAIFTQFDNLAVPEERRVRVRLGQYGGTDLSRDDTLHYTQNSPYVAVCLAMHMGARRIGLLGVDFGTGSVYGGPAAHPLAARVERINAEYARLADACKAAGIELVNLSPKSKLTTLPFIPLETFLQDTPEPVSVARIENGVWEAAAAATVLVVDYDFLTCGRVFGEGLERAAHALGLRVQTVLWSDPELPALVERLRPDLIVVVHGRRFARRWGERFKCWNTAVWLLDEPYEVDDTQRWSNGYGAVFVNDPATLARHHNAHCLPVCFDHLTHRDPQTARRYRVGFVGGANATRERYLETLASAGLLDYVVGGPWSSPLLRKLTLARKITPAETTELYQQTQIVINVFREVHHFNRQAISATAPNPRVLEALACGALVVSERRSGVSDMFPELPQFDTPAELVEMVSGFLGNPTHLRTIKQQCVTRLQGHSYRDRLSTMLRVTIPETTPAQTAVGSAEVPGIAPGIDRSAAHS